jgi:hypothetical protein
VSRPRAVPTPAPVVLDEAALAHRHRWLVRFVTLTTQGEGVLVEHSGTLAQRVAHLERELDRIGKRQEAERFLEHLAAGRRRWPSGDPFDPDRSAA